MRKTLALAAIIIDGCPLFSQEKNFIDQNYVEITARAEKKVVLTRYIQHYHKEEDNKSNLEKKEREMFKRLTALVSILKRNMQIQEHIHLLQRYLLKKDEVLTSKSYTLKSHRHRCSGKCFKELETLAYGCKYCKEHLSPIPRSQRDVMLSAAASAKGECCIA